MKVPAPAWICKPYEEMLSRLVFEKSKLDSKSEHLNKRHWCTGFKAVIKVATSFFWPRKQSTTLVRRARRGTWEGNRTNATMLNRMDQVKRYAWS